MGKLKIHEIAKELGLGSKEIIAKAKELGIEVTSHLSSVDEGLAQKIKNGFGGKAKKEDKKPKEKKEKNSKKEAATPVIIRREVILADEEKE